VRCCPVAPAAPAGPHAHARRPAPSPPPRGTRLRRCAQPQRRQLAQRTALDRVAQGHVDPAARMGLGYAWYPEENIREELASGALVPLPLAEGRERYVTLYLISPMPTRRARRAAARGIVRTRVAVAHRRRRLKVRPSCHRRAEGVPHDRRPLPLRSAALPDRRAVHRPAALPLLDVPQASRHAVRHVGRGTGKRLPLDQRRFDTRKLQVVREGTP